MTDPTGQLSVLRILRDTTTEPALRAALDAAIAALETSSASTHSQSISGDAQVGAAIAGGVGGDVQTGGFRYQALLQVFFSAAGVQQPNEEQREILASYLDGLARRYDRLRLTGIVNWERKRGRAPFFSLSQIYITMASTNWETVAEAENEQEFAEVVQTGNPDEVLPYEARRIAKVELSDITNTLITDHSQDKQILYRLERPILLAEALSRRQHIVLIGGPGSGKSTFLRYLCSALARAGASQDATVNITGWTVGLLLPIYASLGSFAVWAQQRALSISDRSLWSYLMEQSEGYALEGLSTQISRAYRAGRVILLLDGLDEVADQRLHIEIAHAVTALARPGGYVAVTCRTRSFTDTIADIFHDWGSPVEVAPFTLGQMKHFMHSWYSIGTEHGTIDVNKAEIRAEALVAQLKSSNTLHDLGATPLLLTIITILHYYEGRLPEDRADLYEDMVQLLLMRWTQQRREAGSPPSLLERLKDGGGLGGLKEYHIRSLLEALAFQAHHSNENVQPPSSLGRGTVREALISLFHQFDLGAGPANEKAEIVLDYLDQESGIIASIGEDRYSFIHLSLQEYLTSCYLARQSDSSNSFLRIYQYWQLQPYRWREVIFLMLGRLLRTETRNAVVTWLQFLLLPSSEKSGRDEAEQHLAALFAAECLYDIGGKAALAETANLILTRLLRDLSRELAQIVEGATLPGHERVRAGRHLSIVGDERVGVCNLPPLMVSFPNTTFAVGELRGKTEFSNQINNKPVSIIAFEISRYPIEAV